METKELVKKYWFIGVVGLLLVAFVGLYAVDSFKNRPVTVHNKQIDGKYVAYSVDNSDVTADELFEVLKESNGSEVAFIALQRAVFDQSYETTQEMKDEASVNAQTILSYYGEDYVKNVLSNMGYVNGTDDLMQYYIDSTKQNMLIEEYAKANPAEYVIPELGTNGRLIYHILVMVDDVEEVKDSEGNTVSYKANPTEEETEKLNTVLEALKEGMFEQVAYQLTEDTGSKNNGGYIGVVNDENADIYDVAFKNEALRLADGEVSEPICSQFGYHIIYNAGSTVDAALSDFYFMNNLQQRHPDMIVKATMEKAKELGFEVISEELSEFIKAQTAVKEN